MQDGLYVALSSQIALEKRLTTIADNVANMSHGRLPRDRREVRGRRHRRRPELRRPSPRPATPICPSKAGALRQTRQPVRLRHPGRRLVRHRHAGRHGDDPRRPLHHDRHRPAGDASRAIPCSMPAARRSSSTRRTGRPRPAATASSARTASWSARSACSTSIRARISTASAIPASSRTASRSRSSTASMSASCRASSRNPTSIRCSK